MRLRIDLDDARVALGPLARRDRAAPAGPSVLPAHDLRLGFVLDDAAAALAEIRLERALDLGTRDGFGGDRRGSALVFGTAAGCQEDEGHEKRGAIHDDGGYPRRPFDLMHAERPGIRMPAVNASSWGSGSRLRRALVVLAVAIGALAAGGSPATARAADAGPSAVTPWIELELDAIASHRTNPPRAARGLAHLSSAMYLAALTGGSNRNDAMAGAAATVLRYLYPDEAVRVDARARELAEPGSPAFALGRVIGRFLIARAESDGSDAVWTGSPPTGGGYWVPTPPGFLPPLEPLAGTWKTWNLLSGGQFRPGPPPAYGSPQFLAELDEVYRVSTSLNAEQKRIADFWSDGAGTVTPPGHWNMIALNLIRDENSSALHSARLLAAVNTAQADAFIACWDAKFAYWSLRPVTAIRRLIDPTWLSYIVTPPFPSYVSGHSTTSGAASTVLAAFFPDRAGELAALAEEAASSRLYGGIHFASDNEAGLELGRRVGTVAVRAYR
jgi:membrane-associated phospholipid phosphatase